jgi:hypothetical protein
MDILGILTTVGSASRNEINTAIEKIDTEAVALLADIVKYCAAGEIDMAWDCTVQYDKIQVMRELLCELREKAEV